MTSRSGSLTLDLGPGMNIIGDGESVYIFFPYPNGDLMMIEMLSTRMDNAKIEYNTEFMKLEHGFPLMEDYQVPIRQFVKAYLELTSCEAKITFIEKGKGDIDINELLLKNKSVLELMKSVNKKIKERRNVPTKPT